MSRQTEDVHRRIAAVTAAGKGVGKVIAPQLAERGARADAGMVPGNSLAVGTSKTALESITAHLAVEFSRIGLVDQSPSASPRLAH